MEPRGELGIRNWELVIGLFMQKGFRKLAIVNFNKEYMILKAQFLIPNSFYLNNW